MSDFYRKYPHDRQDRHYLNFLARFIVLLSLNSIALTPLLALPTPPASKIDNQATGSFTDGDDITGVPESIVSNVVSVTVAEVAGITISAVGTPVATIGTTVNFDFQIKNIGNDPTKFFLPAAPSAVQGGTVTAPLQIVGYIPAGGTQANITPIDITTATTTDLLSDPTIGGKTTLGSIPPDAAIVVRIRVNISASTSIGSPVSVTLGNTTGSPVASNTPYIANSQDVYTVDNPDNNSAIGEFDGIPINGNGTPGDSDPTKHRQEASAVQTVNAIAPALSISGRVFEDPNYGGGLGRPFDPTKMSGQQGARVELYDSTSSGGFKGFTTTDSNGLYKFDATNVTTGLIAGNTYRVRVVNSTVTSSRPKNSANVVTIIPIQTFRTDASTGTVNDLTNKIGGEKPNEVDANAQTGTQTLSILTNAIGKEVQSIAPVKLSSGSVSGIDFGFNFDTIVNTNNTGQGSLRQFVDNSNYLANTGLNQEPNPIPVTGTTAIDPAAGVETTIFMIPNSAVAASGVAVINFPASGRLIIRDGFTAIDGRTQTTNQGNTNNTILGDTTTAIGIGGTTLTGVPGAEIELRLTNDLGIYTYGENTYIHSIAFTADAGAAIETDTLAKNSRIENVTIGTTSAALNSPSGGFAKALLINSDNTLIDRNLIRSSFESVVLNASNTGITKDIKITNNEITSGVADNSVTTGACIRSGVTTAAGSTLRTMIENNYLYKCAWGIELNGSNGQNTTILKNTIDNTKNSGILINSGEKNHTIELNKISRSLGAGIVVEGGPTGIKVTKNSIYRNGSVGIDLNANIASYLSERLTPNNGSFNNTFGNQRMNYPVIMSSVVTGNLLRVKGFIGTDITTSKTFANANLEFFIADDDGNQNGEVFLGDLRNKPHGEGKTYIDSCAADPNGQFDCTFTVATGLNSRNITATATMTDGSNNTSEFSASPMLRANVLILKRITAINGNILNNVNDNTRLDEFVDDPNSTQDNNCSWPQSYNNGTAGECNSDYILGAIDAGKVKPGDEIEYTIYYLNSGENKAFQGRICDRLNANLTFQPNFDSVNIDRGIVLVENDGIDKYLTNTGIDSDRGQLTTSALASDNCNLAANTLPNLSDDVVVVDIASATSPLIGSIDQINSTVSHGYIRFKVKVK